MDLNDSQEQAEFRAKVRAWLEEHKNEAPPRAPTGDEDRDDAPEARARQGAVKSRGSGGCVRHASPPWASGPRSVADRG